MRLVKEEHKFMPFSITFESASEVISIQTALQAVTDGVPINSRSVTEKAGDLIRLLDKGMK